MVYLEVPDNHTRSGAVDELLILRISVQVKVLTPYCHRQRGKDGL